PVGDTLHLLPGLYVAIAIPGVLPPPAFLVFHEHFQRLIRGPRVPLQICANAVVAQNSPKQRVLVESAVDKFFDQSTFHVLQETPDIHAQPCRYVQRHLRGHHGH
ncbi:unnamed protein product, partial [Ectocarpus sp. 12 AP-2014]